MIRPAFTIGLIHHLLIVTNNYFELKADSVPPPSLYISLPIRYTNMSLRHIPVKIPKQAETTTTIVNQEDYDHLVKISPVWRLNNRGYVVASTRQEKVYQLKYMHKEIAGHTATHVNGDKLDNRRDNLARSFPRGFQSCPPLHDYLYLPGDEQRPKESSHQTIDYSNGKIYSGEIHNGIPHGFGTLRENRKTTLGWFMYGKFTTGLVMSHPPIPDRLKYLYEQNHTRPISAAFLVTKNGTHEGIGVRYIKN
jgi:hypothetical protein